MRALGIWIVAAAVLGTAACGRSTGQDRVDAALRSAVESDKRPAYVTADAEGRKLWKLTRQFYAAREQAPAWMDGTHPRAAVGELIEALRAAADEGLDPELYNVGLLETRHAEARAGFLTKKGFEPEHAGVLDVWLTYLYLKYASDLADGLSDLAHADPDWHVASEKFDPADHLQQALERGGVAASLKALMPDNRHYDALRRALSEYRAIATRGGWPRLPANMRVKPGARSPHLRTLATRLSASGDYDGRVAPETFDRSLQDAVKRFQRRHGLAEDGALNAATIAEMNVPVDARIRQIELNLERWRWLPRKLGDRYVLVNIPEYRLEIWENGRVPLTMRVVVGKPETPTPIFSEQMTYLVFSPYWNVPPSIAEGETLPEVLRDPGFLDRTNMEVVNTKGQVVDVSTLDLSDPTQYRFRQRPGADNSLGLVKFMFPNQHNVYLHDTPADSLFARVTRSFSHGCVRLEDPVSLARYVLADQSGWTEVKINEAMHAGDEKVVKLRAPLPVYLSYWTARVGSDGLLRFSRDVYGIDRQQSKMLTDRLTRLRKAAAAALEAERRRFSDTDTGKGRAAMP